MGHTKASAQITLDYERAYWNNTLDGHRRKYPELYDGSPPSVPVVTSEAAAESVRVTAGTLRFEVLRFIQERGAQGATDEEIVDALGMAQNTERPRRRELVLLGCIEATGTRTTRSGRRAQVWVVCNA